MGTLKFKYHTAPCANGKPNWRLPGLGHVVDIFTTGGEEVGLVTIRLGRFLSWFPVFSINVSDESDLLRKHRAQKHMEEFEEAHSQSLARIFVFP